MTDQAGLPGGMSEGLAQIAGLILSEETLQSVLDLVVALTTKTIDEAHGAGVTMYRDGKFTTAAHSDDFVLHIDAHQYERQSGPCVSAIIEKKKLLVHDLTTEQRWPHFSKEASAEGIKSVLSIPFIPLKTPIGALNIYSRKASAFDEPHEELATLFANQAAVVLANSQAYADREEVSEQLREALRSRETIGEAKGILMHRDSLTSDEAFDELRKLSQSANRKLRDIAEGIVSSLEKRRH